MKIVGSVPSSQMKSNAARFYAGDILYGRLRPYLNKVAAPSFDGLASAEFIVFPDTELVRSSFLKYRLNSADFVSFASHLNEGDRPRVNFGQIGEFRIFVPPPAEQLRIVAKIEELFSELDKGIESLKTAREQLKVYRQAVLKHAFEGKLTAQWREENKDKLETADQLLARIQKEREARYQQQVEEWEEAVRGGEVGDKLGKKPRKPESPSSLEIAESSSMPHNWLTLSMKQICSIEDGDRGKEYPKKRDFSKNGYCLFLNTKNVTKRGFNFDELSFISEEKHKNLRKGTLLRGDLIFTSRGTIGNIAYYANDIPYEPIRINSGMFLLREYAPFLNAKFFMYFLQSPAVTMQIGKLRSGSAQPQLPIREFNTFLAPVPSKIEQQKITQELEKLLSVIDENESEIEGNIGRIETLRQSILKKAFSGQLVPQDPNDESASVLLERIKAEKAKQSTKPRRKRKPRKAAPA